MANMQNEKQRKIHKVHEKNETFQKKVDEQSKGTITRKIFAQTQKY